VSGDLAFSVAGAGGATSGRVEGRGNRVLVRAEDPVAAFRAASAPGGGRPALGGLGDLLAEAGLVVEVAGPDGVVATLGDGVDSLLGRLTAGSRRVQPGSARAVRPLVVERLREAGGGRAAVPLAAVGVVLAAAVIGLRRGRYRG
jgi:hypothetical protein